MAWRTCSPFWPRSARGYVRALGQTDVVADLSFYASALDLLAVRVGGLKVHVAGQRFSVRVSGQSSKKVEYSRITTIAALLSPGCKLQRTFNSEVFSVISHLFRITRRFLPVLVSICPQKMTEHNNYIEAGMSWPAEKIPPSIDVQPSRLAVIQCLLNLAWCLMSFSATNPALPSSSYYSTVYRSLLAQDNRVLVA